MAFPPSTSDEDRFFLSYGFHLNAEWEPDRESLDALQLVFHLRLALPERDPLPIIYLEISEPGDTFYHEGEIATVYAMKL